MSDYRKIPTAAGSALGPLDRLLLSEIAYRCQIAVCDTRTNRELAEALGCCAKTVTRHLQKLSDAGLLIMSGNTSARRIGLTAAAVGLLEYSPQQTFTAAAELPDKRAIRARAAVPSSCGKAVPSCCGSSGKAVPSGQGALLHGIKKACNKAPRAPREKERKPADADANRRAMAQLAALMSHSGI